MIYEYLAVLTPRFRILFEKIKNGNHPLHETQFETYVWFVCDGRNIRADPDTLP